MENIGKAFEKIYLVIGSPVAGAGDAHILGAFTNRELAQRMVRQCNADQSAIAYRGGDLSDDDIVEIPANVNLVRDAPAQVVYMGC